MTDSPEEGSNLRYTKGDLQSPDISGWLVKEGRKLKHPTPRFLRLQNSELSNHKEENGPATWTASLVDSTVGPGPRKNELLVQLPKRRISFFAESTAEFERWIFALKKASSANVNIETFYSLGEVIGEGINGDVLKGWDRATKEAVAIKSIPYGGDPLQQSDPVAETEIQIVKSLRHPYLVKTYDVFRDLKEKKVYMVMEYVAGGELWSRVAHERGNLIKEGDAIRLARNILSAIIYLHERDIVHRDVKLENVICLDPDIHKPVQVKLADFGLSSRLSGKHPSLQSHVGTLLYLAPEIIKHRNYGASVDLWACGVLFYVTLSQQFPFYGKDEEEYCSILLEQELDFPEEQWANISDDAKDFVRGLLAKDPNKRLTAEEALKHRWVAESGIPDFDIDDEEQDNEDLAYAAPKSIFGGKRRTPAQILAKVKSSQQQQKTAAAPV